MDFLVFLFRSFPCDVLAMLATKFVLGDCQESNFLHKTSVSWGQKSGAL